jgi:hypothetical protein
MLELIDQYIILSIFFTIVNIYCIRISDIEIQATLLMGLGFFNALSFLLVELIYYPFPQLIFFILNLTINLKMILNRNRNRDN